MSKFDLYWEKEIIPDPPPAPIPQSLLKSRGEIDDHREPMCLPVQEMFLYNNFRWKGREIVSIESYFFTAITRVDEVTIELVKSDAHPKTGEEPHGLLRVKDVLPFLPHNESRKFYVQLDGCLWRMTKLASNGFGRWAIFELDYVKDL